jgi:SAM-dependent methyltransferase
LDTLYSDAELYDLVAPASVEMQRFYVDTAGGPGRTVLDLACGTGRFSVPLVESGAEVTGGDLSATMLERARASAAGHGVDIKFVQLDMREFELDTRFDSVVIAANSLMHLHTHEDFARCFSTVRRHLKPKGKLLFDVFVPSPALLILAPGQRQHVNTFTHPSLGQVAIEETISYEPISQVSHVEWYWSTPTSQDFRRTPLKLRQIYPQELPLLLSLGGLNLRDRYGDFAFGPIHASSRHQVCVSVAA